METILVSSFKNIKLKVLQAVMQIYQDGPTATTTVNGFVVRSVRVWLVLHGRQMKKENE